MLCWLTNNIVQGHFIFVRYMYFIVSAFLHWTWFFNDNVYSVLYSNNNKRQWNGHDFILLPNGGEHSLRINVHRSTFEIMFNKQCTSNKLWYRYLLWGVYITICLWIYNGFTLSAIRCLVTTFTDYKNITLLFIITDLHFWRFNII